ncbi:RHS repeat-associated core domain-containing protein [Clostridium sp. HBUAS56017]|uniref:RHS repeat domain-containing protein n=1 Tax=Clostridium sp. HBUAS56017 TaxID=2571128 RepID=UPI00242B1C4B|nr:RHS repeat-associated core domain-containing protein [Clostridium sp. HBUAS56017]
MENTFYDKEADYYFLQSRMYDPSEGRFIQEDSFRGNSKDPLSLNLYTYCVNNPMVYDDQNGHWPEWISKAWNVAKDIASSKCCMEWC